MTEQVKSGAAPETTSVHVITCAGRLSAGQLKTIAEAAERFGTGEVRTDAQGSVKIPGIAAGRAAECRAFLEEAGLPTGAAGRHIRPVTACNASACRHGLLDADDLAREIHERFVLGWRDVTLPAKFKISVGGCPNNCAMPNLCDVGVIGVRGGYRLLLGGRGGRRLLEGRPTQRVFADKEEMLAAVERAIQLYREEGLERERFGELIERLGPAYVEERIAGEI